MTDGERPTLRALPVHRFSEGQEAFVALSDPLGLARPAAPGKAPTTRHRSEVVLPAPVFAVAIWFDGRRTIEEIALEWSRGSGIPRSAAEVRALARDLSDRGLLDDERFAARRAQEWRAFKSSPERPFVGAGVDYEAAPLDLRIRIAGLVANDWDMPPTPDVFGLITPACDFARAGRLYARSYAALRHTGGGFARVLLLGQLRAPLSSAIVALDRPFATPFGPVACDLDALRALGLPSSPDELAHRGALVLERQVLFLRILFPKLPVVPVLAASLDPRERSAQAEIEAGVAALERVLALPGRTLVVCATDVEETRGRAPDAEAARALRDADRECIEHATRCDAAGFVERAGQSQRSRAANLFATWLFLRLAAEHGTIAGTILGYQQMPGPDAFTTAASVLYHASSPV